MLSSKRKNIQKTRKEEKINILWPLNIVLRLFLFFT